MRRFNTSAIVLLIVFFMICGCAGQEQDASLNGPYFNQQSPGKVAQLFRPGHISTYWSETYCVFLNDGKVCVYSRITDKGQESLYTWLKDGQWTAPQKAPFEELQGHPNYTSGPEGKRIYFHSGRAQHPGDTRRDDNVWAIEWNGEGWAEPYPLSETVNSTFGEAYPTVTLDGSVYYFGWKRPDTHAYDIYFNNCMDGEYQPAERLPWPINTDYIEFDPYVAPDGSYIIFGSGRPGGYGASDNYISFRKEDGSWTSAINLGKEINSFSGELCASGTPDGRYFFFSSGRKTDTPKGEQIDSNGSANDYDIYWVGASFFDDLKATLLNKDNAADVIEKEYRESGIQPAVDLLSSLYANDQERYYFLPYELLAICERLLANGNVEDADILSQAILETLPTELKIKEGYAITCALNGYAPKGMEILKEPGTDDSSFDLNDTLSNLGYLLSLYPDKTEAALAVLLFTVKEFPDSPFPYFSLAKIYRDQGKRELAISHCKTALELRPNFGDAAGLLQQLEEQ